MKNKNFFETQKMSVPVAKYMGGTCFCCPTCSRENFHSPSIPRNNISLDFGTTRRCACGTDYYLVFVPEHKLIKDRKKGVHMEDDPLTRRKVPQKFLESLEAWRQKQDVLVQKYITADFVRCNADLMENQPEDEWLTLFGHLIGSGHRYKLIDAGIPIREFV